jgi:hypothetical protein
MYGGVELKVHAVFNNGFRWREWKVMFSGVLQGGLEGRWVVYFTTLFSVGGLYGVDNRIISEWWYIGKDLVGSSCGLILRYYPGIRLEGLRKNTKNRNQEGRSPGKRIEPGTSRIRSTSVTSRPQRMVDLKGRVWTPCYFLAKFLNPLLSAQKISDYSGTVQYKDEFVVSTLAW